jgi:aminoglycoside phosphotransferase (APT) family kinase protein
LPHVILRNPERDWMRAAGRSLDPDEVMRRIGPITEPLELLGGGLNNVTVRVGRDRVLRIYNGLDAGTTFRDAAVVGKEATLASTPWRALRTPTVLAAGADFLVFEYVEHEPLSAKHGAAVGRALAEIHSVSFTAAGLLGADLELRRPTAWGPPEQDAFTARDYGHRHLADVGSILAPQLAARIAAFLDTDPMASRNAADAPVLTHSDFKVSNVHWTATGMPLVLDWEYAWAGSRYVDIGQLLRWYPPETFVRDFADAYVDSGGMLVDDWRRLAETIDLCSLIGLFRRPEARSTDDLAQRILETIGR